MQSKNETELGWLAYSMHINSGTQDDRKGLGSWKGVLHIDVHFSITYNS